MEKYTVIFLPDNKEIEVEKGKTILSCAISAGLHINSSCGGDGVCGRCKVIVRKGKVFSPPTGRITPEEKIKGYYLACLASVESDLEVEVPPESRIEEISEEQAYELRLKGIYEKSEEIEKEDFLKEDIFIHSPLATKLYLELPLPDLKDKISDLERLYRQIRKIRDIPIMQIGLANIRRLGQFLRESDWKITVTLGNRNGTTEIVLIEPGDTSSENFGIAFDIGTTTISAQLINLNTREILGTKATYNKQASFGSDIISRIIYAQEVDGLEKLHHAVIDGMNIMIKELIQQHHIDLNDVAASICAGNTTMVHLLLKVDPKYIRREPYVPTANFIPVIRAAEAGIKINPRGLLACVPGVSSYVGGDVTSGVLACGINKTDELSLLIDVGTNGEVVLGNKDWLVSCAASAGPAFEGSGLAYGMRASKGAIQRLKIDAHSLKVNYETIGDEEPKGICGSGYIDILAELLQKDIIDRNGKFKPLSKSYIKDTEYGRAFILVSSFDPESEILITEADIENLKRSKAAIFAATATLVKDMNLKFSDIQKVFIAGGFGSYLDIQNAITIGLLCDLPREKFVYVGNSSLAGARQILLSSQAFSEAEKIAQKITYFELSVDPGYMDEYTAALFFPHTDLNRFPSLKID